MALHPGRNGGGYQSASSCCGFVEWIVDCVERVWNWEDRVRIPTPLHGEWAAPASHRIRSPSPRVLPRSPLQIVEVTSALLASGLLSNTDCADCCVRHAELTLKRRLLNGRLDLSCTRQRSCTLNWMHSRFISLRRAGHACSAC